MGDFDIKYPTKVDMPLNKETNPVKYQITKQIRNILCCTLVDKVTFLASIFYSINVVMLTGIHCGYTMDFIYSNNLYFLGPCLI